MLFTRAYLKNIAAVSKRFTRLGESKGQETLLDAKK